jgi:hypothetical protein
MKKVISDSWEQYQRYENSDRSELVYDNHPRFQNPHVSATDCLVQYIMSSGYEPPSGLLSTNTSNSFVNLCVNMAKRGQVQHQVHIVTGQDQDVTPLRPRRGPPRGAAEEEQGAGVQSQNSTRIVESARGELVNLQVTSADSRRGLVA